MPPTLNLSAYRFVALDDPHAWRASLLAQAQSRGLRGTVLLAREGINLFLAGPAAPLRGFLGWLVGHEPFVGLQVKQSWSDAVPFGKLRVKVKPEIIRMNQPAVGRSRAPAVDAPTLARWLDAGVDDAGREVVMLDTRNAFEVDVGRFAGALDWRLSRFSGFGPAAAAHLGELAGRTVVTYCTGGIRCEKAARWLGDAGVDPVLQLDGGILKYFEQVGARHFVGQCFVFDARGALDSTLAPAPLQAPLHAPPPAPPPAPPRAAA